MVREATNTVVDCEGLKTISSRRGIDKTVLEPVLSSWLLKTEREWLAWVWGRVAWLNRSTHELLAVCIEGVCSVQRPGMGSCGVAEHNIRTA